jgi:hypothetical protein
MLSLFNGTREHSNLSLFLSVLFVFNPTVYAGQLSENNDLLFPSIFNEHHEKVELGKLNGMLEKPEKIRKKKAGTTALNMTDFITFFALVKGQTPTNNLDAEETKKLDQRDIYATKYYPQRIKYTVEGRILHLEARIKLPVLVEHPNELLQMILFVDSRPITIDQNTWACEIKQTTINGAGIGITWNYDDNFAFQAYIASELEGQVLAISPALSNLYWIQAVKFF